MRDIRLLPSLDRWPRLQVPARRVSYSLAQLLERRLWLFIAADLMFVITGLIETALTGARLDSIFFQGVLYPSLVLGIPAMSGVVAIERRSGSLDLALAVPSTERYFLRRLLPVSLFLASQGLFLLTLSLAENAGGWARIPARTDVLADYGRAVYQTAEVQLFLVAAVLFWAVRLRSTGGVAVATFLTTACFWPWLSESPSLDGQSGVPAKLLGVPEPVVDWIGHALVLGLATVILYLYARERVRRPETMLT